MSDPARPDRADAVRELASLWSRVSRQHLAGGGGCGCGFGGLVFQAADFELDIVEFLLHDAQKAGRTAIAPFIDASSKRGPDRYSLPALLDALAGSSLPDDDTNFAITRLRTTLASIEDAHRTSRFACN